MDAFAPAPDLAPEAADWWFDTASAKAVAGFCAVAAVAISSVQIVQHLRHYTEPVFQRYIVRLVFSVPVYALCSFPSLLFPAAAPYIAAVRDCYEAWIIYNFMALCLAYVGGAGAVDVKMAGVTLPPSWHAGTCCLPPLPVNGRFVRWTKQGALQFVIIKPVLAVATLALYAAGDYEEGDWSPATPYLWITLVYNATYTIALYALLLFYLGLHELLAPFRPLLKFVLIKSTIFLTFWQAMAVAVAVGAGAVPGAAAGAALQNFLICAEMLPAAIAMLFAFPWAEYSAGGDGGGRLGAGAVGHALSLRDVVSDTVHQFAPTYTEYVLYSDAGGKGGGGDASPASPGALEMGGGGAGGGGAASGGAGGGAGGGAAAGGRTPGDDALLDDNPFAPAAGGAGATAEERWRSINL